VATHYFVKGATRIPAGAVWRWRRPGKPAAYPEARLSRTRNGERTKGDHMSLWLLLLILLIVLLAFGGFGYSRL
jgi:hypothetical protein